MTTVAVVYHSASRYTKLMADAVLEGAGDRGINRLGIYLGVGGQADYSGSEPALIRGDRESGEVLGAQVARVARAMAWLE